MARLPYLTPDDLPEDQRELLARDINLNRLLAHHPDGARAFGRMGGWIRFGQQLDPRLRELAILTVGWQAGSAYEWSHHVKLGFEFGCTEADIDAIALVDQGEVSQFDELDLAVVAAARQMADEGGISDGTWAVLANHLSTTEMMELMLAAGFYCMVVRVLATPDIDVEDDYLPYLERFPLPRR